jgi:2-polyprenyl-3-methyl-5-hydroxy-6-metoxy-1,4-benzoquinol methylase
MNRTERQAAHAVQGTWVPNPDAHLKNSRDRYHFYWICRQLGLDLDGRYNSGTTVIDIGCYDGWLDFLLIEAGFLVEGVELNPNLCESARNYAAQKKINYRVNQGFFEDVAIDRRFEVAMCLETLEHIPLDMVPVYVAKMEAIATGTILISLPDQRHEENAQHLWTPSMDLILSMWGLKKNFEVTYKPYPGTDIPANFLIRWDL